MFAILSFITSQKINFCYTLSFSINIFLSLHINGVIRDLLLEECDLEILSYTILKMSN